MEKFLFSMLIILVCSACVGIVMSLGAENGWFLEKVQQPNYQEKTPIAIEKPPVVQPLAEKPVIPEPLPPPEAEPLSPPDAESEAELSPPESPEAEPLSPSDAEPEAEPLPPPDATPPPSKVVVNAPEPKKPIITVEKNRKGEICDAKKCLYQIEFVETTCSTSGQCEVTRTWRGSETEILTPKPVSP